MTHPDIWMSRDKELDYFVAERNWNKGVDWYTSHFRADRPVRGESSPSYTNYPRCSGVPGRMHALIPDAKLIFLVRPPIERIVAHYVHNVASGREHRSLDEVTASLEHSDVIARSKYYLQIAEYLRFYPRSRILVIMQEDLRDRRTATLQEVFRFLEVDPAFRSWQFRLQFHRTHDKRKMTRLGASIVRRLGDTVLAKLAHAVPYRFMRAASLPFSTPIPQPIETGSIRRRLILALQDDVRRFEDFTGRNLSHWLEVDGYE